MQRKHSRKPNKGRNKWGYLKNIQKETVTKSNTHILKIWKQENAWNKAVLNNAKSTNCNNFKETSILEVKYKSSSIHIKDKTDKVHWTTDRRLPDISRKETIRFMLRVSGTCSNSTKIYLWSCIKRMKSI